MNNPNPCDGCGQEECFGEPTKISCKPHDFYLGYQEGLNKAAVAISAEFAKVAESRVKAREREIVEWLNGQTGLSHVVPRLESWLRKE